MITTFMPWLAMSILSRLAFGLTAPAALVLQVGAAILAAAVLALRPVLLVEPVRVHQQHRQRLGLHRRIGALGHRRWPGGSLGAGRV